ncbi:MAG: DUF1987 domain-containing protein [Bacteroidales bacterium]|nr:DUF1987 domain-containing protein [Bacteroidales bacterium]
MTNLNVHKTEDTPEVVLNAETKDFRIQGDSMPEDSMAFYTPIIDWLTEYTSQPFGKMSMVFRMTYFNTASAKQLARILAALNNSPTPENITVIWRYDNDDNEMLHAGERYSQQLKMKFEFEECEPLPEEDLEEEGLYHVVPKE